MKEHICVGLGGFIGAVTRFLLGNISVFSYKGSIPVNTLFINVTGSFILALILTAGNGIWIKDEDVKAGITVGILGAYTTFSTFCKETVELMQLNSYYTAALYVILSFAFSLLAAYCGGLLGRRMTAVFMYKQESKEVYKEFIAGLDSEVD